MLAGAANLLQPAKKKHVWEQCQTMTKLNTSVVTTPAIIPHLSTSFYMFLEFRSDADHTESHSRRDRCSLGGTGLEKSVLQLILRSEPSVWHYCVILSSCVTITKTICSLTPMLIATFWRATRSLHLPMNACLSFLHQEVASYPAAVDYETFIDNSRLLMTRGGLVNLWTLLAER